MEERMNGVRTAFGVVEEQIAKTSSPQVLRNYCQHVRRLMVELDRSLGVTRGTLIEQEDLLEQGRALLLRIEQRISEETVPDAMSEIHPIFAELLKQFTVPFKKAA